MKLWPWLGDAAATAARRQRLLDLLGERPARDGPALGHLLATEELASATLERWELELNREETVPAVLLVPHGFAPRGLVLYAHAHGNTFAIGKDELLNGRPALAAPPYGDVLPALGFAVLAIDHWCFGERSHRRERAFVKRLLWQGQSLWGWRVHDNLQAHTWLRAQPRFAGLPCAVLGLSMGSTMAVWTAALEPRIDACIDLCCLADWDALLSDGSHDLHGEYFFVPGLQREFSAAEISALIAPRPHLSLVGRDDPLTPPAGVASIDTVMRDACTALGCREAWQQRVFDTGHQETPAMRAAVIAQLLAMAGDADAAPARPQMRR